MEKAPDSSGCNVSVTVNSGSTSSNVGRIGGGKQLVTITPLSAGTSIRPPFFNSAPRGQLSGAAVVRPTATLVSTQQRVPANVLQHSERVRQAASKLDKVFLKATYKSKKEIKKFTLRNVEHTRITSSDDLKDLIKTNLHDDIKSGDFDVGYMIGTEVIRVRTEEDLKEMWNEVKKNQCIALWCDGLVDVESGMSSKSSKSGSKRKRAASNDESEDETTQPTKAQKKKKLDNDAKVQEIVDSLKSKYGMKYTVLQLRIWAELISSGLYNSTEEPPCNNSMFQRAGGGSSGKKKEDHNESGVAQALTAFAQVISGATKAVPPSSGQGMSTFSSSPARLIDSRSKLYKQLSELQNLKSAGILTEDEYVTEKETIMDLLKQLKNKT